MFGAQAQQQQSIPDGPTPQTGAQQSIPDAPKPQALPGLGDIAPGKGTTSTSNGDDSEAPPASAAATPAAAQAPEDNQPPVETEGRDAFLIRVTANFVDIPFTVKDSKGRLVPGLKQRDIQVYENGVYQNITDFTTDRWPLSVALVIDQSMTHDNMQRVNEALGALPGAFAPYDEVAVFTYNNGTKMVTNFTASQSARLTQAVEISKASGREPMLAGSLDGPLTQNQIVNNQVFDPNTSTNRMHSGLSPTIPRDVHTLNDAILAAATALSKTAKDRRRIIYVISDGKEYGSVAKTKEVIEYLQRNKIGVYGTIVGDSAVMGIGYLDRMHLPFMMRDNNLPPFANATGGNLTAEFRTGAIQQSFAKIISEAGNQYTLGYITHEPFIDGKYRTIEVRVIGHGKDLTIIAKKGYFPSAMDGARPQVQPAPAKQ
jgi:VWFA-related protein